MTAADHARRVRGLGAGADSLGGSTVDLEGVLDATDIGVLLLDDRGVIRRFSPVCARYLKATDADIGRPFHLIETRFDRAALDDAIARSASGRAPAPFRTTPTDAFPRTLLVNVVATPIGGAGRRDGDGTAITLVDVTVATAQDRELEQAADRLAHALNDSGVVLWERTLDMEPVWASDNFAEIVGFSETEWRNFPYIDNIHPDDVSLLEQYLAVQNAKIRAGDSASTSEIDYRYRGPDGTYRTVNARILTAEHDGRTVIRGRNIDVTDERAREAEQQELNRELDRLNRSLSGFTQMVSHDLRAPLRHVVALAGFMREDIEGPLPEPINERLFQIEERAKAMSNLIDDLLEYARSGSLRTEAESTDIGDLLADTIELVDTRDGIDVSITSEVGTITTHTVPLAACVRNLVDNAVKYHPGPTGTVGVTATLDGGDLLLVVTDDGNGVDPVHHQRIFEPMQSLERGTGLGLASVKKILDERNGSISLESEPGHGATFTMVWPLDVGEVG